MAASAATERVEACAGVFPFIGAVPYTDWLRGHCELDDQGFVLTDRHLSADSLAAGTTALPFETSWPGVFAVGDVGQGR